MRLKAKILNLRTGGLYVVVLNHEDAKSLNIYPADRIEVSRTIKKKSVICVADISSGENVKPGHLGIFDETAKALGLEDKVHIEVKPTERPISVQIIRKKIDGGELKQEDFDQVIRDIANNNLSDIEITYFVAACYTKGMTLSESHFLTNSVVDNAYKLNLKEKIICDKHCIGGIPGNRTTMVVVPIIAAAGFMIPKTSSRSISSPAGTSDTVEVLAPVYLSPEKVKDIIKKTKGIMIWESSLNPKGAADKKLIDIRHPLSIDPEGMLLASIMAKKKAVGATHVLIDIPIGKTAKVKTYWEAIKLRGKFLKLGRLLKMKTKVIITDGSQPIGNGIGPSLEARDVISVLQNNGPNDLRNKSIALAIEMLKMVNVKNPKKVVLDLIESGKAYAKFMEILYAQGGRKNPIIPLAEYHYSFEAKRNGVVKEMDNYYFSKVARIAGAPKHKTAGIYLRMHVGDHVKKGDELFSIYAETKENLEYAKKYALSQEGMLIR